MTKLRLSQAIPLLIEYDNISKDKFKYVRKQLWQYDKKHMTREKGRDMTQFIINNPEIQTMPSQRNTKTKTFDYKTITDRGRHLTVSLHV